MKMHRQPSSDYTFTCTLVSESSSWIFMFCGEGAKKHARKSKEVQKETKPEQNKVFFVRKFYIVHDKHKICAVCALLFYCCCLRSPFFASFMLFMVDLIFLLLLLLLRLLSVACEWANIITVSCTFSTELCVLGALCLWENHMNKTHIKVIYMLLRFFSFGLCLKWKKKPY